MRTAEVPVAMLKVVMRWKEPISMFQICSLRSWFVFEIWNQCENVKSEECLGKCDADTLVVIIGVQYLFNYLNSNVKE